MATPPTSPRDRSLSSSSRRGSNPFTRNQDNIASISASLRRQSLGGHSASYSETIEEGSEISEDDLAQPLGPGPHVQTSSPPEGSASGGGTGHDANGQPSTVGGIPIQPSLQPAGGSRKQVKSDGIADPVSTASPGDFTQGL